MRNLINDLKYTNKEYEISCQNSHFGSNVKL